MHCKQWIFDMDGTLTDSMVVVWEGAPEALLARFGRTPKADLHETLLTMGMEDGAQYLIREYALPLDRNVPAGEAMGGIAFKTSRWSRACSRAGSLPP